MTPSPFPPTTFFPTSDANAGGLTRLTRSALVADDPVELEEQRYYTERMGAGRTTWVGQSVKMPPEGWDYKTWLKQVFIDNGGAVSMFSNWRAVGTTSIPGVTANPIRIDCYFVRPTLDYSVFGDPADVEAFMNWMVEAGFTDPIRDVTWVYGTEDRMQQMSMPLDKGNTLACAYPWLPKTLPDYITDFLNTKESILILLGPPGTGKTSFIKELIVQSKYPATVSYTPALLGTDGMFANFISSGDEGLLILEDADAFLTPRSQDDGSRGMHRLLNVADGIISLKKKKLVFTTNLQKSEIDHALMRPGRCYDVITSRPMTREEAVAVRLEAGMSGDLPDGREFTLAEALRYRADRVEMVEKSIGFF